MHDRHPFHAQLFGPEHASQYDAGASGGSAYHAMHEVIAATMADELRGNDAASLLIVGVGTGQEVLPYAKHGAPEWRFTGVDTSPHMLAVARGRLTHAGLIDRTVLHAGALDGLHAGPLFDGAQMVGVLHHVEREQARTALLSEVTRRLQPGAPLLIGESASHVDQAFLSLLDRAGFKAPRELLASPQFTILLVRAPAGDTT